VWTRSPAAARWCLGQVAGASHYSKITPMC